jgi:hypothetical protein
VDLSSALMGQIKLSVVCHMQDAVTTPSCHIELAFYAVLELITIGHKQGTLHHITVLSSMHEITRSTCEPGDSLHKH